MKTILKANIFASKANMTQQEWLDTRRMGIGGSDAAAIIGMNPYSSPFSVFADKTGRLPPQEDNEAMRQGRDLEWYVAERFKEDMADKGTPKKTKECGFMLQHPKYPFMLANVDRLIIGEKAGLECKTTSVMNLKKFKNGEYPEHYYAQCVHYLAVTGAERWYLGVVILNQGYKGFVIERDEAEISTLIDAERQFWELVQKDTPPSIDGSSPTAKAINAVFGSSTDETINISQKREILNNLIALKAEAKTLDTEITKCENILKAEMGEAENAECDNYKITWRPQTRNNFDKDLFMSKNPKISLAEYYKQTQTRVFNIKEIKK